MQAVSNYLSQIKEQMARGEDVRIKPRDLISQFGAYRRGAQVVYTIRQALKELNLRTEPDFEHAYIDAQIQVLEVEAEVRGAPPKASIATTKLPIIEAGTDARVISGGSIPDPVPRIASLGAANRKPVCVSRDTEITEAVTIMLLNNYSQLPVVQNERNVYGMVSWRSIGSSRVLRKKECRYVRDCLEPIQELSSDMPLFEAIEIISKKEVVLIKDSSDLTCGIVTTADLSLEFGQLFEPFLLIGEIENHIRRLIDGKFSIKQLRDACDKKESERELRTVADLTFGQYVRLLESPECWKTLNLNFSRAQFIKRLNHIREIRNDVMHFNPDPLEREDLELLRDTVKFFQNLYVAEERSTDEGTHTGKTA